MNITEAEQIVAQELGAGWSCVKLGRYWLVGRMNPTWNLVAQATTLPKAIAQAKASA